MNDNSKLFSILAYIGILFLVGLIADPQNPKVKFHCNQGLVLFICEIILGIVLGILTGALIFTAIFLVPILTFIVWAFNLGFSILGIINAAKGEEKRLPVIGKFDIIK